MPKAIGGIIEDMFHNGFQKMFGEENWSDGTTAPVNILETDAVFEMHLYAPGLKKEDFKINVDRNILHVSHEHKEEQTENGGKWLRKEYRLETFRRSFTLSERININGISARYEDGILKVSLPKKEPAQQAAQEIKVS